MQECQNSVLSTLFEKVKVVIVSQVPAITYQNFENAIITASQILPASLETAYCSCCYEAFSQTSGSMWRFW